MFKRLLPLIIICLLANNVVALEKKVFTAADKLIVDDAVVQADFNANSILAADTDDIPTALTIPEQTVVGRITAGNIDALTVNELQALINVEDGATGDQSDAEIKAAYENNANTNGYTDAEQAKLGYITVTGTVDLDALETASHAAITVSGTPDYITLSGQDIVRGTVDIGDDTNLAGTANEIILTGDILSLHGDITRDSELHDAVTIGTANGLSLSTQELSLSAATNSAAGAATAEQITKLEGIESGADVTDATNVDAAGAVMNTGNETIAGTKTFSSFPVGPSSAPTTDYQLANKKYVDDSSGTGDVTRQDIAENVSGRVPAYYFDGTNDYISLGTSTELDPGMGDCSIIALVNNSGGDGVENRILNASGTDWMNFTIDSTGYLKGSMGDGTTRHVIGSTDIGADGLDHWLEFTLDRSSTTGMKLYIDGAEETYTQQDDPTSLTEVAPTSTKYIGTSWSASSNWFSGDIRVLQFWNMVVPDAVRKSMRNSGGIVPFRYQGASQTDLWDSAASVFTSGTYGWTAYGTNTVTNDSNTLKITYVDTATGAYEYLTNAADLSADLTPGKRYLITFDAWVSSGASVGVRVSETTTSTTFDSITVTNTSSETKTLEFTCGQYTPFIAMTDMGSGESIWFDNLHIKQIGCVADFNPGGATPLTWFDASGNDLDGTVSGATVVNAPTATYITKHLMVGGYIALNQADSSLTLYGGTSAANGGYIQASGASRSSGNNRGSVKFWANTSQTYVGGDDHTIVFGQFSGSAWTQIARLEEDGDAWFIGDVSALSFTDRTPFYEGDALAEIEKIKGVDGEIDHSTLPEFVQKERKYETVSKITIPIEDADKYEMVVVDEKTGALQAEIKTVQTEPLRDIGGSISMNTVAIQQLWELFKALDAVNDAQDALITAQDARIKALETAKEAVISK